jgi:hypothetical protein
MKPSRRDRTTLRTLAARFRELAALPVMMKRRRQWTALKDLQPERPMVLFETSLLENYVDARELVCTDPELRADGPAALDGHPFVAEDLHGACAARHDAHIADILPLGPVAGFIHKVGVFVLRLDRILQRPFPTGNLAHAQHVGLAHQDVNLYGLAHVRFLAVRPRKILFRRRLGVFRCPSAGQSHCQGRRQAQYSR